MTSANGPDVTDAHFTDFINHMLYMEFPGAAKSDDFVSLEYALIHYKGFATTETVIVPKGQLVRIDENRLSSRPRQQH